MNILHICLNGAVTDGLSYQDNLLPKYHKKMGLDVTVLTSLYAFDEKGKIQKLSDEYTEYINSDGVKIIRIPMKKGQGYNTKLKRYVGLEEVLIKECPDIIFIHDFQYPDTEIIAKYLEKHKSVTAYADNHADYSNSATSWISKNILHRIIWRYYAKKLSPFITKFYGVLPARVDFMKELYGLPENKCELLVMGADDELVEKAAQAEVRNRIRKKYNILDDDFLVMTGGKIDAYKTQTMLLLQAIRNIDNDKVKLVVFGSVSDELKDEVNSLVDGVKIQYIGWINTKDSYDLFASADLIVFPGRHSVYWEQVAGQGIPMIVKDWNGTHHIDLGGNVEFIKEDSVAEIQRMVKSIVESPAKYKMMKQVAVEKGSIEFSYKEISKRAIKDCVL